MVRQSAGKGGALIDQATRQTRYNRFAEMLGIVLQHPATPEKLAHVFKLLVKDAARLADLPVLDVVAPREDVAQMDARQVFLDFGLAVADVLEDDGMENFLWNEIGDATNEVEELLQPKEPFTAEASRLRGIVKEYARVQGLPVAA
ncbi:MAG: hypothetical protein ABI977_36140 [Acidobacteriota bacterium]